MELLPVESADVEKEFRPLLRPRLIGALGRHALTVLHAPHGFGKSTLVDQWRGAEPASGVREFHMPEVDYSHGAEGPWHAIREAIDGCEHTPGATDCADARQRVLALFSAWTAPVTVIFTFHDRASSNDGVEAALVELAEKYPHVRIVATTRTREAVEQGGHVPPGSRRIDAGQLRFTDAELAQLCRLQGIPLSDPAVAAVNEQLGGIPFLVRAALPALRNIDTDAPWTDDSARAFGDGPQWDSVGTAIRRWIESVLSSAAKPNLATRILTLAAVLERVDQDTVRAVFSESDAAAMGDHAHDLGLLASAADGFEPARTWQAAPAVRPILLDILREGRFTGTHETLVALTAHLVSSGDAARSVRSLIAAEDWDLLLPTVRDNFALLINSDIQLMKEALELLPAAVARRDPVIDMARTMFAGLHAGMASLVGGDTDEIVLVDESGKTLELSEVLSAETVWSIILRLAGKFTRSSTVAGRISETVDDSPEDEYRNVKSYLPIMRIQWAINHQLAGRMDAAHEELRRSLAEGNSSDVGFVAKNAAGLLAMNHAMGGETTRARSWLSTEARYPDAPGWLERRVRIPGLVSRVHIALDGMDLERAGTELDALGVPDDSEEFWAAVIVAHASVEHARGRMQVALDLLGWARVQYKRWCTTQSFSDVALKLMEADLHTALGRGTESLADLRALPESLPVVQARVARVHLLSGDAHATLATVADFSRTPFSSRPFIEMRLMAAAAHAHLGELDRASACLQRAVAASRDTGAVMPLLSLPRSHREKLLEVDVVDAGLAELWRRHAGIDLYPREVTLVTLSARELVVLRLAAEGNGRRAVAEKLFVSENTVKTQLRSIYKKLAVTNRAQAIEAAERLGLL